MQWKRKNGKNRLAHGGRVATVKPGEGGLVVVLGEPGESGRLHYRKVAVRKSRTAARNAGERAIMGKKTTAGGEK